MLQVQETKRTIKILRERTYTDALLAILSSLQIENYYISNQKGTLMLNPELRLALSPPDGPYGQKINTAKGHFTGGKVRNIVVVLTAVFYNSLRFHLTPKKSIFIWVLTVN